MRFSSKVESPGFSASVTVAQFSVLWWQMGLTELFTPAPFHSKFKIHVAGGDQSASGGWVSRAGRVLTVTIARMDTGRSSSQQHLVQWHVNTWWQQQQQEY